MVATTDLLEELKKQRVSQGTKDSIVYSPVHDAVFSIDEQTTGNYVQYSTLGSGEGDESGSAVLQTDKNVSQRLGATKLMAFNSTCTMLLLVGDTVSVYRAEKHLSRSMKWGGTELVSSAGDVILHADWHPMSAQHVVVLAYQRNHCVLSVYCLPEHGNLQGIVPAPYTVTIDLAPWQTELNDDTTGLVSFAFGPQGGSSYWERFTVYLLHRQGHVFALCPIVPFGIKIRRDDVAELFELESGRAEQGEEEEAPEIIAIRDLFPTFDPRSTTASMVEVRIPSNYPSPGVQLVHASEGDPITGSPISASSLCVLNPDGLLPIFSIISSPQSDLSPPPSECTCTVEIGVLLHVIGPYFGREGLWSREAHEQLLSLATLDFKEWPTTPIPTRSPPFPPTSTPPPPGYARVILDAHRPGTLFVVQSHNVFRVDVPAIGRVDGHCRLGGAKYGQWSLKEPLARELLIEWTGRQPDGRLMERTEIVGACISSRLEGTSTAPCLFVRRRGDVASCIDLAEPEPLFARNILEVEDAREDMAMRLKGTDAATSIRIDKSTYVKKLESDVRAAKSLLGSDESELLEKVVGPRRWLETRLADRVNEYCTSMLPQQKKQAEALGQKLQDQEDLKELQDRISTLKRHLDGSTELLKNLAGNIQTLRSRMTPEELEAQHALTVAEKRVERLQRVAETVQKGVLQDAGVDDNGGESVIDRLHRACEQQQADANDEVEKQALIEQMRERSARVERLLENLQTRSDVVERVLEREMRDDEGVLRLTH